MIKEVFFGQPGGPQPRAPQTEHFRPILNRGCGRNATRRVIPVKLDDCSDDDIPILLYDKRRADFAKSSISEVRSRIPAMWGSAVRCGGPSVRLRPGSVRRRRSARSCPTFRPLEYVSILRESCTNPDEMSELLRFLRGHLSFARRPAGRSAATPKCL